MNFWLLAAGLWGLYEWRKRASPTPNPQAPPPDLAPYMASNFVAGGTLLGNDALGQANIADGNGGILVNDQPRPLSPGARFTLDLNGIIYLWQSPNSPWEPYVKIGVQA